MTEFVRRSWLREHAIVPITAIYLLAALVLGAGGSRVGAQLLGDVVSPVSSASAIAILSAIASGMMALTAIVFSLSFVAIQIAGTTYSPRLWILGRTPFLAHALGLFTGTFLYALLAIRTVDFSGSPGINVSVVAIALLWLCASIAVLVLLVPRVRGLLISNVLTTLYDRAAATAVRIYPAAASDAEAISAPPPDLPVTSVVRHVGRPRYLVGLDLPRLVHIGVDAGAVVVISPAIGDPVVAGDRLAIVLGASRPLAEARLRDGFWLAPERSVLNDPAYAIRLLVDVAIRALSPAVNDPTTAVTVLDELDGLLRLLAGRQLENDRLADRHGVIRVIWAAPSWDDLVALALTEIQQYGRDSFQVQRRIATLLGDLFELLPTHRRTAIDRFARWRATSASKELLAAEAWAAASACDRQGLGHPVAHDGEGKPPRPPLVVP